MEPVKKRAIARCTPTLGPVSIWWAQALERVIKPNNICMLSINVEDVIGGEIAECRNRCVALALAHDGPDLEVSHLWWVDDDVIIPALALRQLLCHERDICSGVYFEKGDCGEPLLYAGRCAGALPFVPDRLVEVWGHGMGLTLVKTDVYRRMAAELDLGVDKYGNPAWYMTPQAFKPDPTTGGETVVVENGLVDLGGTEDLYFLENAAKLGYRPLADTGKWAFGFHYDLRKRTGYPAAQWAQYERGQAVTWPRSDGTVVTWE